MARRKKKQPDQPETPGEPLQPAGAAPVPPPLLQVEAGEPPTEDPGEARIARAFFGRACQLAALAEFLLRRINVAIPEVDVVEDVFVVKGRDEKVMRVQIRGATAEEQQDSYTARFNVSWDQLSLPGDKPPLVYVLVVRRSNCWSDFLVIRRATLFRLHEKGAGTRATDSRQRSQILFRIVFRETTALSGPREAADFQPYRDAWEPWPPP
jgi:hypothetical protein